MAKKYRSGFEENCGTVLEPAGFDYEPFAVKYTVHRKYTPDFVYPVPDSFSQVLVEVKGYFREGDTLKYKSINKSLLPHQELVFLLQTPTKQVRKGGPLTLAGWCTKNNIRWFSNPKDLIKYAEGLRDAYPR